MQHTTVLPTEAILNDCIDRLRRLHLLLRANMPRTEFQSLRERRLWKVLDRIREAQESLETEVRQGCELAADRRRKAVRP